MTLSSYSSSGSDQRGDEIPAQKQKWVIKNLLDWISADLKKRNFDNPRLEAELLLGHVLKMERLQLYLNFDMPLEEHQLEELRSLVQRRRSHEPLQYIFGNACFRKLNLAVGPGVLIPRPETEMLVDIALGCISKFRETYADPNKIINVLELGTGSANIAISIAVEDSMCNVWTVENYGPALKIAAQNISRYDLASRVKLLHGSWFEPVRILNQKFHLIIANPPYIPSEQFAGLPAEVRQYEPKEALDGGAAGLRSYPEIFKNAKQYLEPEGIILVECGEDQADSILTMINKLNTYTKTEKRADLTHRERFVLAYT